MGQLLTFAINIHYGHGNILQNRRADDDNVKRPSKRPDLKAMKKARCKE